MKRLQCPVREQAKRRPSALALVFGDRTWTYAELDEQVAQTAEGLRARGVSRGDRVGLCAFNGPACVELFFAVRRLGATLVAFNPRLTAPELQAQEKRVRPQVTFAASELQSRFEKALDLKALRGPPLTSVPSPAVPLGAGDPWVILFTSGTSGEPKAAVLSVQNFQAAAESSARHLGSEPSDGWLCAMPLFHVGGLAMVVRVAQAGARLVLLERFDAQTVREALAKHFVTHVSFVPATLAAAMEPSFPPWPVGLKVLLLGGSAASPRLVQRARAAGLPVLLTYGLTEATSQVCTEAAADADGASNGRALPGMQVRIVDAGGEEVLAGVDGEIEVQGKNVISGYWEDAGATRAAFRGKWLRTRDLGVLDLHGRLRVLARRTDLIVSGGENVYPAEVESVLERCPEVTEVAVVGAPDLCWGEVPVAFFQGPTHAQDALESLARRELAAFKIPKRWIAIAALPRTAAGKVARVALKELAASAWRAASMETQLSSNPARVQVVLNSVNPMNAGSDATEFLQKVERALEAALGSAENELAQRSEALNVAGRHLCLGKNAKRARPLMVQLFGQAVNAPDAERLPVAVAAELVHSASLLHDDVVDSGMFRRGRPTVNALWGNITAVMAGDLLLTIALQQLGGLDRRITFKAVDTVAEMTRATIIEVEARGDLTLEADRFRHIAEGKTGALFGFCGSAAALLADQPEAAQRFDVFGRHLGVAFQIADDLKDLNGGDAGKPRFADFRSRTPSLPILLAAQQDASLRKGIKDLWAFGSMPDDKVKELGLAVLASTAPAQALAQMQREISAALDSLGAYAQSPGGAELQRWALQLSAAFQ